MSTRTKRQRAPEPPDVSDAECDAGASTPGAAERKRALERNRRNLVNVRFAELEAQLARLPGAPTRVYRRIDKEVVLKDAAQALASQQRELELATARVASMRAEIDTLRSEKLELRHDKAYLHKEVAGARAENATLGADNLKLWCALRKSGALKAALAADFAKVPIDVVLGASAADGANVSLTDFAKATADSLRLSPETRLDGAPVFEDPLGLGALPVPPIPFTASASASTDSFFADDLLKGVGSSGVPRVPNSTTMMQLDLDISKDLGLSASTQIGPEDMDEALPDVAPCG